MKDYDDPIQDYDKHKFYKKFFKRDDDLSDVQDNQEKVYKEENFTKKVYENPNNKTYTNIYTNSYTKPEEKINKNAIDEIEVSASEIIKAATTSFKYIYSVLNKLLICFINMILNLTPVLCLYMFVFLICGMFYITINISFYIFLIVSILVIRFYLKRLRKGDFKPHMALTIGLILSVFIVYFFLLPIKLFYVGNKTEIMLADKKVQVVDAEILGKQKVSYKYTYRDNMELVRVIYNYKFSTEQMRKIKKELEKMDYVLVGDHLYIKEDTNSGKDSYIMVESKAIKYIVSDSNIERNLKIYQNEVNGFGKK